ncbi:MAG: hypothetical protein MK161_14060, partial [Pirellulales bacterium]|nr:hypothetical protein [Pirellulales bacterium]
QFAAYLSQRFTTFDRRSYQTQKFKLQGLLFYLQDECLPSLSRHHFSCSSDATATDTENSAIATGPKDRLISPTPQNERTKTTRLSFRSPWRIREKFQVRPKSKVQPTSIFQAKLSSGHKTRISASPAIASLSIVFQQ